MSTNLVGPPHHQVGEHSDPQDGAEKRGHKIPSGRLEHRRFNHVIRNCPTINRVTVMRVMDSSSTTPHCDDEESAETGHVVLTGLRTSGSVSHSGNTMGSRSR